MRDIAAILRRQRQVLIALPLLAGAVALFYTFLLAQPVYESVATVNISPTQIRAQLEQKIQVQQQLPVTFEGYRAVAFSREILEEARQGLKAKKQLPTRWQDERLGLEAMVRSLKLKDVSPKQQALQPEQPQQVIIEHRVRAPSPEIAAEAVNLWTQATIDRINELPLERSRATLKVLGEQLKESEARFRDAQARWEAFNRSSSLPQDKAELDSKTNERVQTESEMASLQRDLEAILGRTAALRNEANLQAQILPTNLSTDQLVLANRKVEEAKRALTRALEKTKKAYEQASLRLEAFQKVNRLDVWNSQLSGYVSRYQTISVRLSSLVTERSSKQARQAELETQIQSQPKLLELEREVLADPVVAQALAKSDSLAALAGLKLKTQELNPSYQQLLQNLLDTRVELASLEKELSAIKQEKNALSNNIATLKSNISAQEQEREAILIDLNSKKAAYEALRTRYDQIIGLDIPALTFDNPNPEYQRLRSILIDAQIEDARLSARIAATRARLAQIDARIQALKEQVAQAQVEADRINQQLEIARNEYLALAQKGNDLKIEIASSQNTLAQILAPAYPIYEKVAPKRLLTIALAVVLGGMVALLWAFLAEALAPRESEPRVRAAAE